MINPELIIRDIVCRTTEENCEHIKFDSDNVAPYQQYTVVSDFRAFLDCL